MSVEINPRNGGFTVLLIDNGIEIERMEFLSMNSAKS